MGRDGLERRAGVVKPHRDVLRRAGLVGVDRADDVVGLGDDADLGRVLGACALFNQSVTWDDSSRAGSVER